MVKILASFSKLVADLLTAVWKWDSRKPADLIPMEWIELIFTITIPRIPCLIGFPVRVIWGPLSTWDVYNLLKIPYETGNKRNFAWIWKAPIANRVKFFWWKVAWYKIPCKSLLAQSQIFLRNTTVCCDLCSDLVEDTDHVMVNCALTRQIVDNIVQTISCVQNKWAMWVFLLGNYYLVELVKIVSFVYQKAYEVMGTLRGVASLVCFLVCSWLFLGPSYYWSCVIM